MGEDTKSEKTAKQAPRAPISKLDVTDSEISVEIGVGKGLRAGVSDDGAVFYKRHYVGENSSLDVGVMADDGNSGPFTNQESPLDSSSILDKQNKESYGLGVRAQSGSFVGEQPHPDGYIKKEAAVTLDQDGSINASVGVERRYFDTEERGYTGSLGANAGMQDGKAYVSGYGGARDTWKMENGDTVTVRGTLQATASDFGSFDNVVAVARGEVEWNRKDGLGTRFMAEADTTGAYGAEVSVSKDDLYSLGEDKAIGGEIGIGYRDGAPPIGSGVDGARNVTPIGDGGAYVMAGIKISR
jgi:hypothetical protein